MTTQQKSRRPARTLFRLTILAVATLLVSQNLPAQTQDATLRLIVIDPSGAVIPQARVAITNVSTGVARTGATDGRGQFVAVGLIPGSYTVHVDRAGFKSTDIAGIVLQVGGNSQLPIHLQVGKANESVTVNGSNVQLLTTSPAVSAVITREEVKNMPLNGQSFQDLELLTPGSATINPQNGTAAGHGSENGSSMFQIMVNGDSGLANDFIVDGLNMNVGAGNNGGFYGGPFGGASGTAASTILGNTQALVPADDLQEFRVETNGYEAEYGGYSGGQFIFATRSGTNKLHGTASDYLRNTVLDANDYFDNYYGVPRQPLRQNDFAGAVGGPIWLPHLYNGQNKTFFFVDYEGLRANLPLAAYLQYAPDAALDAATTGPIQAWLLSLPKPNGPDLGDGLAEYTAGYAEPTGMNTYNLRIDHVLSPNEEIFARASNTTSNLTSGYYGGTEVQTQNTRTYSLGLTSSFKTNLTNQLRAGFSTNAGTQRGYQTPMPGQPVFNPITAGGYPANIANIVMFLGFYPPTGSIFAVDFNGQQENREFEINESAALLRGKHQIKVGVDYRRLTSTFLPESPDTGYLWLAETAAQYSNPLATAQLLEANTPNDIYNDTDVSVYPGAAFIGLYLQDEWAVNHRLNISYGLRWDYFPTQTERRGANPYTLLNQNDLAKLSVGPQAKPYDASLFNFEPRLGVTSMLSSIPGHETQLRGGVGVYYDAVANVTAPLFGMEGPGESGAYDWCPYSYCNSQQQLSFPLPKTDLYTPITPPVPPFIQTFNAVSPHLADPYTIQTNVAIQQQFGYNNALTFNYVGAFYRKAPYFYTQYVYPYNHNFQFVSLLLNGLRTEYNSGQLVFQHRLSNGLFAYGEYTWAHDIGESQINVFTPYEKGNTTNDLRNNLNVAVTWSIPTHIASRPLSNIFAHWGADVRFFVRTSFPFTIYGQDVQDPAEGGTVTPGLSYVPNTPVYLYGTYKGKNIPGGKQLNPAAFTAAPLGQNGTVPLNHFRGFGMNQWNVAIRRTFQVYRTLHLTFRLDSFNLFNRANFGSFDTYLPDVTFGEATSSLADSISSGAAAQYESGGPRNLQAALILNF